MNLRLILLPFSAVYAGIARLRNVFFNAGVFKQKEFSLPVILVGNLSVGGTGKTPHVEYLVQLLHRDYHVATLSRGYGRKTSGYVIAGKGVTSSLIGDEPMQYFSKFDDITVAVCENRVEGIQKLMAAERKPQVVIMDDGFQHRQVNPGFKILLTSIDRLFTRDFVLPAGDLREPRSAFRRADCIIVTRCDENMPASEKEKITGEIQPLQHQQIFFSSLIYGAAAHFFSHETIPVAELKNREILLFTGIANPEHLQRFLQNETTKMETLRFSDHHDYTAKDITLIKEKFDKFTGPLPIILTTEKDYQRFRYSEFMQDLQLLPCYYLPITIQIDKQELFSQAIRKYVEENTGNS